MITISSISITLIIIITKNIDDNNDNILGNYEHDNTADRTMDGMQFSGSNAGVSTQLQAKSETAFKHFQISPCVPFPSVLCFLVIAVRLIWFLLYTRFV